MNSLLLLIYSGFTINLVLQCALDLNGVAESRNPYNISSLIKLGLIFLSVIILWFLFSRILFSISSGLFIYVLLFPVSAIFYSGLEYLVFRLLIKKDMLRDSFVSFPGGITAVAAFICINISGKFFEVAVLSFGFVAGIFMINLIVTEIRKRAALETIPVFLRGKPLVLIAMGLLSLVFTTASFFIFRMINTG